MKPYPIFLRPTGKDYLWGGSRLNDDFGKKVPMTPLAETWECSTHPEGPCYAVGGEFDGHSLSDILTAHPEYLGKGAEDGEMPILVKFIDAKDDLSVQVHPTDEYAAAHENGQRGKTEMWYVLDADEDTSLVCGFKHDTDIRTLRSHIEKGRLEEDLQRVTVSKNDAFLVEAGTVHAIGRGALIAEIQENSNLTYRLYDYNRTDINGQRRPLHVDKALDALKLTGKDSCRLSPQELYRDDGFCGELLCRSDYFEVFRLSIFSADERRALLPCDENSFRVLLCIEGGGELLFDGMTRRICKGDCVFLPADSTEIHIYGHMRLLVVRT